jgi:hypothetical protein
MLDEDLDQVVALQQDFNNLVAEHGQEDEDEELVEEPKPVAPLAGLSFKEANIQLQKEIELMFEERKQILQEISRVRSEITSEQAQQKRLLDSLLVLDDTLPPEFARRVEIRIAASALELSKAAKSKPLTTSSGSRKRRY